MKVPHEDPRENQADVGGSTESGPNSDSTGSQEGASNTRTVAEQSAPLLATLLATRPPERKALKRFLSRLCDDPDEVDAVIQEIEALSAERVQISIRVLEWVLLKRLDALDARLDARDARLDAQTKEIRSLTAEVRAQSERIDKQGDRTDQQGGQIAELTAEIVELKGEARALNAGLAALGVKLDSAVQKLTESNASLRRENRIKMALLAVLIALGVFGWLGESCSRPVESNAGVEASQGVGGSGRDMRALPAETREPSTESSETDGPAEDDGETSVSDPGNGR